MGLNVKFNPLSTNPNGQTHSDNSSGQTMPIRNAYPQKKMNNKNKHERADISRFDFHSSLK